ncbi:MAG: hypothetical protein LBC93_08190 [Synergistaceae bacterium]|jgi:hypothetical protein|nr:hypothetical protein [Synergistaceae bacterium]
MILSGALSGNERLFFSGLMDEFEKAREKMIEIKQAESENGINPQNVAVRYGVTTVCELLDSGYFITLK